MQEISKASTIGRPDFGQFSAFCDSWAGSNVREDLLENSDMLFEMCGGNRLTLTDN